MAAQIEQRNTMMEGVSRVYKESVTVQCTQMHLIQNFIQTRNI